MGARGPKKLSSTALQLRGAGSELVRRCQAEEGVTAQRLAVVAGRGVPAPPDGLHATALALWHETMAAYVLDGQSLAVFTQACHSLSRAEEARKLLTDGLVQCDENTGKFSAHPAVKVALEHRQLFAKLVRELGFDES